MRRGNSSGSVYKLQGKRRKPWTAVAPASYDDNGKAKRNIIGYFTTRASAEKALADYIYAPFDIEAASVVTFGEMFEIWYKRASVDKAQNTIDQYNLCRRRFQELMQIPMRDVRYPTLEKIMDNFSKLSYSSKSKYKQILSAVFETAIKREIVTKNYAEQLEIGKEKKSTLHKIFSNDEILWLWQHREDAAAANMLVLIYTGLRPEEALIQPITNEDIEKGYFIAIGNKNETSKGRMVPIHPCLKEILKNRTWLIEGSRLPGRQLSYSRLISLAKSFGHLPHDGRHTCATLMKLARVEELARKKILGHAADNITDAVYTHLGATYLIEEFSKVSSPEKLLATC